MNCADHPEVPAVAYCRECGKPMCVDCRRLALSSVYCAEHVPVAEPAATAGSDDPHRWSRVRVATKYPTIARRHFAARGVHADVVHLNGAMELAPTLGLARLIVDLVATGSTLKANGLVETEVIDHITSRLIVNRTALKTQPEVIGAWIARFRAALESA